MTEWYFRPKQPGEPNREPIHGEFFASDAISDPGTALVREGIQNALDAGAGDGAVLVRIHLSGGNKAVSATDASQLLGSAWAHFSAEGNGLQIEGMPTPQTPCRYIAFEDFATSGLEGDATEAFRSREGEKNHFYHFFRAEGQSDKESSDRGSWGVGKHVFLRSSQVSTIFGLTVRRNDKRRMLMGKSVLKSHWVDDDYCQDGYFGIPPSENQRLVLPVEDAITLNQFADLFDLQRGESDSGLSVVVLWPDPEITDQTIINAVLRNYFYPILSGQLEVIVETELVETSLDDKSLLQEVDQIGPSVAQDIIPLIELSYWAQTASIEGRIAIKSQNPEQSWEWSNSLLNNDQLEKLRAGFYAGNKLAVRVPVSICKRDVEATESFFDVYMTRDSSEQTGRPTFIRDGIIISEVNAPRTRGVRAIVVVQDKPLAAFLRKAENPSHTGWDHARLKGEYKQGYRKDLEFVKHSVHELIRIMTATETEKDTSLLADFFSIPASPEEETVKTKRHKGGKKPGHEAPQEPVIEPQHPRFRIQKLNGGFSILPGSNDSQPPDQLDIQVAYDIRRGNPLKKYNSADFEFGKDPIQFDPEPKNINIVTQDKNRIIIDITGSDFSLHVTGFDERRQIYVKATPKEKADDSSQI